MTQNIYKGFEIRRETKNGNVTVDARRYYPSSVHRGFPAPFTPVYNGPSPDQASMQLETFITRNTAIAPSLAMG